MSELDEAIENAISKFSDTERLKFALRTPDLYPAKNVATTLGIPVSQVHAWRRERGIKKARS